MDGMRTLLIIVGFIVILAALGHGLWAIRKNSQNGKSGRVRHHARRQVDNSGFDEYGIGPVRTIKNGSAEKQPTTPTVKSNAAKQAAVKAASDKVTQPPKGPENIQQPTLFGEEETPALGKTSRTNERKEPSVGAEQLPMAFGESDSNEQPSISSTDNLGVDTEATPAIGDIDTSEQAVGESIAEPAEEELLNATDEPEHAPVVISLYVSGDIQGAILLQTVTELGFKFGEMDIFHRHEDTTGKGPSLFSLANMYNPGVFNLDEIETFTTRGVALFMELPVPSDGHKAFTMMYNAANKIAEAMPRAAVLDSNRNPITKQSVQHTYQKIREFERRQHVADAARN